MQVIYSVEGPFLGFPLHVSYDPLYIIFLLLLLSQGVGHISHFLLTQLHCQSRDAAPVELRPGV